MSQMNRWTNLQPQKGKISQISIQIGMAKKKAYIHFT